MTDSRGTTLTIDAIDQALASTPAGARVREFDLRHISWIEVDALLYLLSVLLQQRPTLKLPRSSRQRDFLRRWGVPTAYEDLQGQPFEAALERADILLLEEDKEARPYPYQTQIYAGTSAPVAVESTRFYAIQYLRPLAGDARNLQILQDRRRIQAIDSRDEWRKTHIGAVLGQVADRISQSVLYELILNSLWHSDAKYVITVSDFDRQSNTFSFAVFDNGRTIQSTLRRTGLPLTSLQRKPLIATDATFTVLHSAVERNGQRFYEGKTPPGLSIAEALSHLPPDDASFLVAALFPGVSSRVTAPEGSVGLGLFDAVESVVADQAGTVRVRAGWHDCEITPGAARPRDMLVKVDRRDSLLQGNLVSVRFRVR